MTDQLKKQGVRRPLALAFKNAGLGLAIATIVLVAVEAADMETYVVLLAIALAVGFPRTDESARFAVLPDRRLAGPHLVRLGQRVCLVHSHTARVTTTSEGSLRPARRTARPPP